ncbi:hypothetical protein CsSME_00047247 [Camellia sinensis var. sinensis]
MELTEELQENQFEEILENMPQKKQETRDEMLSRHRKEIAMKKATTKGSKAEQKAKKKKIEEEVSQLSANIKERHAKKLASLGYSSSNDGGNKGNLNCRGVAQLGQVLSFLAEIIVPLLVDALSLAEIITCRSAHAILLVEHTLS